MLARDGASRQECRHRRRAQGAGAQGGWRVAAVMLLAASWAPWPWPAQAQAQAARPEAASPRVAMLPVELLKADYFPQPYGVTTEEQARLDMVAEIIRERLAAEGYRVVSSEATRDAVTAADPGTGLHECNGCERDIGAALEADWVLVGWVQLVSNLIVNLNVVAYDVGSGRRVAQAFVDLRGNNERSWRRATQYLLDRILVQRLNRQR